MDELDLFRNFRRGADTPSADAQRRASDRLESVFAQAPSRAQADRRRGPRRWRHIVVLATAALVLVVGTASAFGTVRDLFLGIPNFNKEAIEEFDRGLVSAFLVSDPWHNARIQRMAADLGIEGHASATWTSAARTEETRLEGYVRETFAYLYYRVTGR